MDWRDEGAVWPIADEELFVTGYGTFDEVGMAGEVLPPEAKEDIPVAPDDRREDGPAMPLMVLRTEVPREDTEPVPVGMADGCVP